MNIEMKNNIKILYLSHSSMWPYLEKLNEENGNLNIDFYKGSSYYIKNRRNYKDCDLIVFYSSCEYADFELKELKSIASRISDQKEKRVTIGYSYMVPEELRIHESIKEEIKINSFKNGIEHEETTYSFPGFDPLNLTELVLSTHDELENSKTKKLGTIVKIGK